MAYSRKRRETERLERLHREYGPHPYPDDDLWDGWEMAEDDEFDAEEYDDPGQDGVMII